MIDNNKKSRFRRSITNNKKVDEIPDNIFVDEISDNNKSKSIKEKNKNNENEGRSEANKKLVKEVMEKVEEKEKKKDNKDKEKEDTIDLIFAEHLIKQDNFAVELDENSEIILYKWVRDKMLWKKVGENDVQAYVSKWLRFHHKKMYKNSVINNLTDLTSKVIFERGRKLEKTPGFIISTNTHFLEVDNLGNIKATLKATDKDVKDKFCRVHVDIDLDNVKNGIYKTKSDKDIENDNKTLFAKMIRASFPDEENRKQFQEFYGDTINPTIRKCFPVMVGDPDGGKSQWLKLLQEMHTNSTTIDLNSEKSSDYSGVIGKSLVIVDEIGRRPSEVMLKRLVGGASIFIDRKYMNPLSIKPDFKFFAADNFEYNFSGKSGAIATRFYLFKVEEVKREDRIDEVAEKVAKSEMRDVLDWMLNGAIRIVKRGRILRQNELSNSSLEFYNQMKKDTNPTLQFLEDYEFEYDSENLISANEIYEQFKEWCVEMGHTYASRVSLSKFSRDFLTKAIKDYIDEHEEVLAYKKRPVINYNGRKIRATCYPLKYNKHSLANILNNNYSIPQEEIDEYIAKKKLIDEEKQKKLQETKEYKEEMRRKEEELERMLKTGEARRIKGGIEYGDEIDF